MSSKSAGAPRATSQKLPALDFDNRSVASSKMSGASKLSKGAAPRNETAINKKAFDTTAFDTFSLRSGSQGAKTEVYSEIEEEDEWTAIQKFNTLLHYEEQK